LWGGALVKTLRRQNDMGNLGVQENWSLIFPPRLLPGLAPTESRKAGEVTYVMRP